MQRAGIPLFVAFFSALLLPLPASAESELWTCNRVDGSIMFTNKSQDLTGCSQYRLRTELGFFKGTVEAKKEVPKPTAAPQEPTAPSPLDNPAPPQTVMEKQNGLRRLSSGDRSLIVAPLSYAP